jgi:ATP-dependent DNA ligase
VRLFTRRGYDWTDRYPLIRAAVAALARSAASGQSRTADERIHARNSNNKRRNALATLQG